MCALRVKSLSGHRPQGTVPGSSVDNDPLVLPGEKSRPATLGHKRCEFGRREWDLRPRRLVPPSHLLVSSRRSVIGPTRPHGTRVGTFAFSKTTPTCMALEREVRPRLTLTKQPSRDSLGSPRISGSAGSGGGQESLGRHPCRGAPSIPRVTQFARWAASIEPERGLLDTPFTGN